VRRPNGKGLTDRAGNGQTHAYQRSVKARRDETTKIIEIQFIASKQKKSKAAKVWRVHTLDRALKDQLSVAGNKG